MFITRKRHEREKQELIGAGNRLTNALLKGSAQGLFLLDARGKILPQVSSSLATLFRRQDFNSLTFERLIGPVVTAKTLSAARTFVLRLLDAAQPVEPAPANPLEDVEVRLLKPDGTFETAHYSFGFNAVDSPGEARAWLVHVSDITARVQLQSRTPRSAHPNADPGRDIAQRLAGRRPPASAHSCIGPMHR